MTDKLLIDRHLLVIVTIYNSSPLILTRSLHVASEAQTRLHEVDERDEMWQTYSPNSHWCIRSGWTYRPFGHHLKASALKNATLSYFTISKSYFINYTIPFYNTPYIQKLYYFTFSLKYYFFNLSLLFLSHHHFFSTKG